MVYTIFFTEGEESKEEGEAAESAEKQQDTAQGGQSAAEKATQEESKTGTGKFVFFILTVVLNFSLILPFHHKLQ